MKRRIEMGGLRLVITKNFFFFTLYILEAILLGLLKINWVISFLHQVIPSVTDDKDKYIN